MEVIDPGQGTFWASIGALFISAWAWIVARSEDRIRTIAREAVRDSKEYATAESVASIQENLKEIRVAIVRIENILMSGDPLVTFKKKKD